MKTGKDKTEKFLMLRMALRLRIIRFLLLFLIFPLVAGRGLCADAWKERWKDYQVIMWVGDSIYRDKSKVPLFFQRLKETGVTAVSIYGDRDPLFAKTNGFNYYVENIVNRGLCLKWNSKVTDWDRFIRGWMSTRSEDAFIRDYCLDDPQWRKWATGEMQRVVSKNKDHAPLAYDIRDELSVTISANPFDYDFNPIALNSFRNWLKQIYGTLDALNKQWETRFSSWEEVKPFSTDRIKNRMASGKALPEGSPDWYALQRLKFDPVAARKEPTRWNFSPWRDFREYMDISLASALDEIRLASHKIDPSTPVGIEGTQMPHAFGGYDLWRLSGVLDWVEPYDIGNSREIFGSFMKGKLFVTTVFEKETQPALRRLWHLLLLGDRGSIIWWSEDFLDWKSENLNPTAKALALKPVFEELRSPLARLYMNSERATPSVAFLYSQPSIQVDWLLESTVDGNTWVRRYSSYEASHNRMAKVRNSWLKAFQDNGLDVEFISSADLTNKNISDKYSVIVLPTALAMSDAEIKAVMDFLNADGNNPRLVFCDGCPGLFDEHGRLREKTAFEKILPLTTSEKSTFCIVGKTLEVKSKQGDIAAYESLRVKENPDLSWSLWIKEMIESAGINPMALTGLSLPVEKRIMTHRFKNKAADIYAFEININYHMSEDLKQAGGNEALEKPVTAEVRLPRERHVYDLSAKSYLGKTKAFTITVNPWRPSFIALTDEKTDATKIIESE